MAFWRTVRLAPQTSTRKHNQNSANLISPQPQIFDAAWNELKFGQGAFQGRFEVMIQIYKPIWPDNYFILCDQRAAAYVETFEIVRVPFEMVD